MDKTRTVGGERLRSFFDVGTFSEIGAYIQRPGSAECASGVVCGYGAVKGRLCFAFAQDPDAMKGALDACHAEKIRLLYRKALAAGAPVVGMFDSAGAVIFDGAAALSGYGSLLSVFADASGRIPQIALISGICAGSMAAAAALFDFTVTVRDATRLYVTAGNLSDGKCGTAEAAYSDGRAAILADGEQDAFRKIADLLEYLPDNARDGAPVDSPKDDSERLTALSDRVTADEAMNAVADEGVFLSLYGGVAPSVQTGFALIGGYSTAVLAIDGELTLAGVRKMTGLLRFADAFAVPVLTLVNCTGAKAQPDEEGDMARALADLSVAYRNGTAARITVTVGQAIGAGFIFCGPRSLCADVTLALPGTEISAMSAESAVAFLYTDRIGATVSRADLEEDFRGKHAAAGVAAATGEIDDLIDPAELRARIIAALCMLQGKGTGIVRRNSARPCEVL